MLKKFYDNMEEIIGSILFVVMLVVLAAQTLAHQGFSAPLVWSESLSKLLFIYVGYIGIVASIKDDSHVSVDVLLKRLPPKVRKWVDLFNQFVILCALVGVFILSIPIVQNQTHLNIVSLDISMTYLYLALPILTLLMIYRLIERVIKEWRQAKKNPTEVD